MKKQSKTWNRTGVNNLVRHKTGVYYARFESNGKEIWRSLGTRVKGVAVVKLAETLQQERRRKDLMGDAARTGKMTMGVAAEIRRDQLENDTGIKESTRHYWRQCIEGLFRSWPGLEGADVRKIGKADCQRWAGKFAKIASPTRFNNTLAALKHLFEIGIEAGVRYGNPTIGIKRLRPNRRNPDLPTREKFLEWCEEIDRTTGRFGKACGEFVRFLAFSGLRKGEAGELEWRDIDLERHEIVVRITKNSEMRRVPMIGEMLVLVAAMKAQRGGDPSPAEKVLLVREAKRTMDHAADKVKIRHLTHHDLRHFFATICIESGVDIPTVAGWLGHKDGGALLMKTYSHLRNEHSKLQAARVSLAPMPEPELIPFDSAAGNQS